MKKIKALALVAIFAGSFLSMKGNDANLEFDFSCRFWGNETSWGACGPNTDGTPGCFQGSYTTHYVFWIAGTPKPTGETRPCDC